MADIIIKNASIEDVALVARCTMAAVGLYDFSYLVPQNQELYQKLVEICSRTDTLYSYTNARIVLIGETSVGCLISYPGEIYAAARELTFSISGFDATGTDFETGPGEYYLDSMAILPQFRGNGIGRVLLMDGINKAVTLGYKKVSLIVEKDRPRLHDYYAALGFKDAGELDAFGDRYIKMIFSR